MRELTLGDPIHEEHRLPEPTLQILTPEQPTLQEAVLWEPTSEEPAMGELTFEDPNLENYAIREPSLEQPILEQPTLEQTSLGESTFVEPSLEQSTFRESIVVEPTFVEPTFEEPTTRDFIPGTYQSTTRDFDDGAKARLGDDEGGLHDQLHSQVDLDPYIESTTQREPLDSKAQDQHLEHPFLTPVHHPRHAEESFLDEASKTALPPDYEDDFSSEAHAAEHNTPRNSPNPLYFRETLQDQDIEQLPQDTTLQEASELSPPPEEADDRRSNHALPDEVPIDSINYRLEDQPDMLSGQEDYMHSNVQQSGPWEDELLQEAIMSAIPIDSKDDFPEVQPEPAESAIPSHNSEALLSQGLSVPIRITQSGSPEVDMWHETAASILPEDNADDIIKKHQIETVIFDESQQSPITTPNSKVGEKSFKENSNSNTSERENDDVLSRYVDGDMEQRRARTGELSEQPPEFFAGFPPVQPEQPAVPTVPKEPISTPELRESIATRTDPVEPVTNLPKGKKNKKAKKAQSSDWDEVMETVTPPESFTAITEMPTNETSRNPEASVDGLQNPVNLIAELGASNTFSLKKDKKNKKKAKKEQALSRNNTSKSLSLKDNPVDTDSMKDLNELASEDPVVEPIILDSKDAALREIELAERKSTDTGTVGVKKGKKNKQKAKKAQALDWNDLSESPLTKDTHAGEESVKDLDELMNHDFDKVEPTVQEFEDLTLAKNENVEAASAETENSSFPVGLANKIEKTQESDQNKTLDPLITKDIPPDARPVEEPIDSMKEDLVTAEPTVLDSKQPSFKKAWFAEPDNVKGKKKKKAKKAQASAYDEILEPPLEENLREVIEEDPSVVKSIFLGSEGPMSTEAGLVETDTSKIKRGKKNERRSKKSQAFHQVEDSSRDVGMANKEPLEGLVAPSDNFDPAERFKAIDEEPEPSIQRKDKNAKKKARRAQANDWTEELGNPLADKVSDNILTAETKSTSFGLSDNEATVAEPSQENITTIDDIDSFSLSKRKKETKKAKKKRLAFENEVPAESSGPSPGPEISHTDTSITPQETDVTQEPWGQSPLHESSKHPEESSSTPAYEEQEHPRELSNAEVEFPVTYDGLAEPLRSPMDEIEADSYFSIKTQDRNELNSDDSIKSTQAAESQDKTVFEPLPKDGQLLSRIEPSTSTSDQNIKSLPVPATEQELLPEIYSAAMVSDVWESSSRGADPYSRRGELFENSENVVENRVVPEDIPLPSDTSIDQFDESRAFHLISPTSFEDFMPHQEQTPSSEFKDLVTEEEDTNIREAYRQETQLSSTYMTHSRQTLFSPEEVIQSETSRFSGQDQSDTKPYVFENDPSRTEALDFVVVEDRPVEASEFAEYSMETKKDREMPKRRQSIVLEDETFMPAIVDNSDNMDTMEKVKILPILDRKQTPDTLHQELSQEQKYQDIPEQTTLHLNPNRTDELYLSEEGTQKTTVRVEEHPAEEIKHQLIEQSFPESSRIEEQIPEIDPYDNPGSSTSFVPDSHRNGQHSDPLPEYRQDHGLAQESMLSALDKENVEEKVNDSWEIPITKKRNKSKKQKKSSIVTGHSQQSSRSPAPISEDTGNLPLSSTETKQASVFLGKESEVEEPAPNDQTPSLTQLHDREDTKTIQDPTESYDFPTTKKGRKAKKSKKRPMELTEDFSSRNGHPRSERNDDNTEEISPSMPDKTSTVDLHHSLTPPRMSPQAASRNLEEFPEPAVSTEDFSTFIPKGPLETVEAMAATRSGIGISDQLQNDSDTNEKAGEDKSKWKGESGSDSNVEIMESSAIEDEKFQSRIMEGSSPQGQGDEREFETIRVPSPSPIEKSASFQTGSSEREKSLYRDSGVHVSDSPLLPENPPIHYDVRDSGYQATEGSPAIGMESEVAGEETSGREINSLDEFNPHKAAHESFRLPRKDDYRITEDVGNSGTESFENPLNISIEVDPAYNVSISQPEKEYTPNKRTELETQAARSQSRDDGEYQVIPSKPSMHFHEDARQPSPVNLTTKDGSSPLLQSSPLTRDDDAIYGPRHPESMPHQAHHENESVITPSNLHDLPESHHTSVFQTLPDSYGGSRETQPISLFGGPIGINSDLPENIPSPSTPFDTASSSKRKLNTIKEYSPEESPLHKKSRDISDVGLPEHGVKAARRSATPQSFSQHRVRSPLSKKGGNEEIVSTDDILSRLSWPEVDEEKHAVDLDRSLSRDPTLERRHSNISTLTADLHKHHEADKRSVSGASIRSGDSIHAIIRTPDQVRSASGLSNRSSGTPPLRRVDRSISGDLRGASKRSEAKKLAKPAEAERDAKLELEPEPEPVIPSSSTYDPVKDKGKNKSRIQVMTDVYVSNKQNLLLL